MTVNPHLLMLTSLTYFGSMCGRTDGKVFLVISAAVYVIIQTFICLFKVVKQCCGTDGVESQYIKDEILPHFFKHFWNHRMALDRRNYRQLVDTTVEIANKVNRLDALIGFHNYLLTN